MATGGDRKRMGRGDLCVARRCVAISENCNVRISSGQSPVVCGYAEQGGGKRLGRVESIIA